METNNTVDSRFTTYEAAEAAYSRHAAARVARDEAQQRADDANDYCEEAENDPSMPNPALDAARYRVKVADLELKRALITEELALLELDYLGL